ncbi:MAG: hypothetical protein AB7K64_08870 [Variibacter sp.]
MTKTLIAACSAAGILLGTVSVGWAQNSAAEKTPGHKMQDRGSVKGEPGASGYSPGHKMQDQGSKGGNTGASGYAPGHTKKSPHTESKSGTRR